jgi:hypothetical protein
MGTIEGEELIFNSRVTSQDYHDDKNSTNYNKWLQVKLIPLGSIVILDNASYHTVQENKAPTRTSNGRKTQKWLT